MYIPDTPNQNWTRRWNALRYHEEQWRLWRNRTRFKIVPAGRRSGKTELAKRWLVAASLAVEAPERRYFAAAPTYHQAKRIWWADLKALMPTKFVTARSESELWLRTSEDAEIWVVGLDVAARIEGTPWDGCVIDELANCKPGIWDSNIRPALADRRGWAWLIGVPDMDAPGQIDYEKMVERAKIGSDLDWAHFSWPSADILPAEEVESARRTMDRRIFEQEYLGKFNLTGGRAFPDFDSVIHVKPTAYDPALPICWSLDFNIDPMCSGIIQHRNGIVSVIDEMVLPNTKTEDACREFLDRAAGNRWDLSNLTLYGDASGNARDSTSGTSDWHIIKNALRNHQVVDRVRRNNVYIKDTINAVNARIKAFDGTVRLRVDPKCHQLIKDLRSALWPGDLGEFHAIAWLRYFVHYQYPLVIEKSETGGMISFSNG